MHRYPVYHHNGYIMATVKKLVYRGSSATLRTWTARSQAQEPPKIKVSVRCAARFQRARSRRVIDLRRLTPKSRQHGPQLILVRYGTTALISISRLTGSRDDASPPARQISVRRQKPWGSMVLPCCANFLSRLHDWLALPGTVLTRRKIRRAGHLR